MKPGLTGKVDRAQHARPEGKRLFWSRERLAHERSLIQQAWDAWRRRGIDRRPKFDEFGDTVWPNSGL